MVLWPDLPDSHRHVGQIPFAGRGMAGGVAVRRPPVKPIPLPSTSPGSEPRLRPGVSHELSATEQLVLGTRPGVPGGTYVVIRKNALTWVT